MLRLAPAATILLFVGPVAIGLAGVILPSFGYLPALGGDSISLQPWRRMLAEPGLLTAARLSLTTGFAATALSLVIALGFVAACHGTRMYGRVRHMLAPLLAVPHAAVAIGLAFLIAPSGWASRLASPWATGWQTPPDALIIHDTLGLSLVAGLVVKEVPFLLLAIMAALNQLPVERSLATARTMGYGAVAAWGKAILPLIYRQIRLPVYAVLAFSMSVVDMAIILGPTTPGPLAREIMRLFNDPDLSQRFVAAAAAVSQVLLVLAAIAVWRLGELCAGRALRVWLSDGRRHVQDRAIRWPVTIALSLLLTVAAASFLAMALWSVAGVWRFPDGMPDTWSLSTWHRLAAPLSLPMTVTITTAVASTVLALSLVLACLESEYRRGLRPGAHVLWLVYVPLLVPQIAFLFGNQIFLVALGLDGRWLALIWAHLLFVLPYVFLILADPWRALDHRYSDTGLLLGRGPAAVFWRIKLPMLVRPILFAAAIGFAVSVGQYLPTVFAGGGRLPTITTEAVSLAASGDRRVIGVYAFAQTALPLIAFFAALAVPAWLGRRHRGLVSVTR